MIGFAFCGSFCTHAASLAALRTLLEQGYEVQPIFSHTVCQTDTRFGTASALWDIVSTLCGRPVIHTVVDAEPLGPTQPLEALVLCPCTGNTLAKLANGVTDTPVCMAAKAHLRTDRPLLITLASNDAMSTNLKNIGTLLLRKNVYFVPMVQDDCVKKPHSLVANFDLVLPALQSILSPTPTQLRPLFLQA